MGRARGNPLASLAEMLADHDDEREAPRPLPEAQIAELTALYERYAAGCPFKPGDLVTPRKSSPLARCGEPHVVLEVIAPAAPHFAIADPTDSDSQCFGARHDMRVGVLSGHGRIVAHWVESFDFEPYEAPAA